MTFDATTCRRCESRFTEIGEEPVSSGLASPSRMSSRNTCCHGSGGWGHADSSIADAIIVPAREMAGAVCYPPQERWGTPYALP